MSGFRRSIAAMLLASVAMLVSASPAAAEFGPIRLVSKGLAQQADVAEAPAISADGRYLAFQARMGGQEGVFREDLQTGAIVPVATTTTSGIEASVTYATAPSISADGRYVSFTTRARLDPEDDPQPESSDIYVADMSTSPPSYELASALNGCNPTESAPHAACGLTYYGLNGSSATGAEATGRVALSADGRKVVFVTSAESNLTSDPTTGSTPGEPTPPGQVILRDLSTDRTTLVSVERDVGTGAMTERPVSGGALVDAHNLPLLRGASLSADGTTVAWIGTHLPAQVPLSSAEAKEFTELDASQFPYDEPLWRRVADGPSAPIRRIVAGDGAADPFPNLTEGNTDFKSALGWLGVGNVDGVPQLSADGQTVALIGDPAEVADAFVVDMAEGLPRAEAVRQLTRGIVVDPADPKKTVNAVGYIPLSGHIFDLGISGNGERIAFATARQQFPLAPPNLIGSAPSSVGLAELYLIDLGDGTLQRVTHGLAGPGEPSLNLNALARPESSEVQHGEGASSPSFGAGGLIAFSSTAFNLVAGDGNEASDAFVVEDREEPRAPGAVAIEGGPEPIHLGRRWRLTLSAHSLPSGAVRVVAGVPAAGLLRARVGTEPDGVLPGRRLATEGEHAPEAGSVAIELRLPRRYRRFARTREGVYAKARIRFHGEGGRTLNGTVQVRFHAQLKAAGGHR